MEIKNTNVIPSGIAFKECESLLNKAFSSSKAIKPKEKADFFNTALTGLKGLGTETFTREYFYTFCNEFKECMENKHLAERIEMVITSHPHDTTPKLQGEYNQATSEYSRMLRNMRGRINAVLKKCGYKAELTSEIKTAWINSIQEKEVIPFTDGKMVKYEDYLSENGIKTHVMAGKRTSARKYIKYSKDYVPQLTPLTKAFISGDSFDIDQALGSLTKGFDWEAKTLELVKNGTDNLYASLLAVFRDLCPNADSGKRLRVYRLLKQKSKFIATCGGMSDEDKTKKALENIKAQQQEETQLVNSVLTFRSYKAPVIKPYYNVVKQR